jgi:UrcA family protein
MKSPIGAVLAAALLSCLPTTAALAATGTEAVQARVAYGDLDLSTARGRAALSRRVAASALDVCTPEISSGTVSDHEAHRCRIEMQRDGAAQIEALARHHEVDVSGREMIVRSAG